MNVVEVSVIDSWGGCWGTWNSAGEVEERGRKVSGCSRDGSNDEGVS